MLRRKRQRGATTTCREGGFSLGGLLCVARDMVVTGSVVGLAAWGWVLLMDPARFPVRSVQIDGDYEYVEEETLRAVVGDALRGGFFSADLGGIERSLESSPWIERASVRREWPDRLRIEIAEKHPVARWGDEGLVTADGAAFYPVDVERFRTLPVLFGPEGTGGELVRRLSEVRELLSAADLEPGGLIVDERRAWHLWLQGGIRVSLGRGESDEAIARFARAWSDTLGGRVERVSAVDLRYTNGFSVLWKEDPARQQKKAGEKNS